MRACSDYVFWLCDSFVWIGCGRLACIGLVRVGSRVRVTLYSRGSGGGRLRAKRDGLGDLAHPGLVGLRGVR